MTLMIPACRFSAETGELCISLLKAVPSFTGKIDSIRQDQFNSNGYGEGKSIERNHQQSWQWIGPPNINGLGWEKGHIFHIQIWNGSPKKLLQPLMLSASMCCSENDDNSSGIGVDCLWYFFPIKVFFSSFYVFLCIYPPIMIHLLPFSVNKVFDYGFQHPIISSLNGETIPTPINTVFPHQECRVNKCCRSRFKQSKC